MCFVCRIENPLGLRLAFRTDDEGRCIARFRPKPEHQGYPGQLNGGVISSLLDAQMNPAEGLAVEISQYVGQDPRTLAPRVIGQSAEAQITEATGGGRSKLLY